MSSFYGNQKFWQPNKVWDSYLYQDQTSPKVITVYEIISHIDSNEFLGNKTLSELSKFISSLKKENYNPLLKKLRLINNSYYNGREHVTQYLLIGERKENELEYEQRQEIIRNKKD